MLLAALFKTDGGVTIHYWCDGRFFDLRRLGPEQSPEELLRDFLFADECATALFMNQTLIALPTAS